MNQFYDTVNDIVGAYGQIKISNPLNKKSVGPLIDTDAVKLI